MAGLRGEPRLAPGRVSGRRGAQIRVLDPQHSPHGRLSEGIFAICTIYFRF